MSIINTLKPYLNLYDITVDFNNKYKSVHTENDPDSLGVSRKRDSG
jgi:hypothetical protein